MYVENVRLNHQMFPATRSTRVKYKKDAFLHDLR